MPVETAESTTTATGDMIPPPPRQEDRLAGRILRAALPCPGGVPTVHVLPSSGPVVGEIKVAGERILGDDAVRAVARLVKEGDLEPRDGGFVLSAAGRLRAEALRA